MVGRTTVVIAHRLSTVRFVDRIIVLRAGAIVETGTENELLARNGVYARLHALQFGPKSARFATTS
jgi:subfamily B ATP-binding cassette protein MsbA